MSKPAAVIIFVTFLASIYAQTTTTQTTTMSPQKIEECANKTYAIIKGFKGTKDELLKKLDEYFVGEIRSLNKMPFNEEYFKRVVELVTKRITKDDVLTAEDFQRFGALEIQKLKLEAAKKS